MFCRVQWILLSLYWSCVMVNHNESIRESVQHLRKMRRKEGEGKAEMALRVKCVS